MKTTSNGWVLLENKHVRLFLRVIALCCHHHHPPLSKTSVLARFWGRLLSARAQHRCHHHHHPRKRVHMLIFKDGFSVVAPPFSCLKNKRVACFLPAAAPPTITTLLSQKGATHSFSRVVIICHHHPRKRVHMRIFLLSPSYLENKSTLVFDSIFYFLLYIIILN